MNQTRHLKASHWAEGNCHRSNHQHHQIISCSYNRLKSISNVKHTSLKLCGEEVHVVADGLLHGAFEGLVGGGDRQEEVLGARLTLREKAHVPLLLPRTSGRLLLNSWLGGSERVEEGDGRMREEAGCWELLSSCGEVKQVLEGDGALPNWGEERRGEEFIISSSFFHTCICTHFFFSKPRASFWETVSAEMTLSSCSCWSVSRCSEPALPSHSSRKCLQKVMTGVSLLSLSSCWEKLTVKSWPTVWAVRRLAASQKTLQKTDGKSCTWTRHSSDV